MRCRHVTAIAQTWATPTNITASVKRPEWSRLSGSFFAGPGGAMVLQHGEAKGRMIVPCLVQTDNISFLFATERNGIRNMNAVLISDDSGTNWQLGGEIPLGVPGCRVGNLTTRECDEIQVAEVMACNRAVSRGHPQPWASSHVIQ